MKGLKLWNFTMESTLMEAQDEAVRHSIENIKWRVIYHHLVSPIHAVIWKRKKRLTHLRWFCSYLPPSVAPPKLFLEPLQVKSELKSTKTLPAAVKSDTFRTCKRPTLCPTNGKFINLTFLITKSQHKVLNSHIKYNYLGDYVVALSSNVVAVGFISPAIDSDSWLLTVLNCNVQIT